MKAGNGRQPVGLSIMLRTYFVQQWFNLSDPGAEELLYESAAVRNFVGVDLGIAPAPDETTILRFRHVLEKHDLCGLMLEAVNIHLEAKAESNAWDGKWRLNPGKSQLGGPTFTITISILPQGEFQIVTRNLSYKLICDGKYRLVVGHRSLACVNGTLTSMDVAERDNGKPVNTVHREISPDGKSLTQTITTIDEHGPGKSVRKVFVRFSKPSGLAGEWTDTKELDRQPQIMTTGLKESMFHLGFPLEKQCTDMKLDGSDAQTHGTAIGVPATLSVKPETPQRLLTVQKLNGNVVTQGVLILSSDGRSITEQTWKPEAPASKTRLIYEKN